MADEDIESIPPEMQFACPTSGTPHVSILFMERMIEMTETVGRIDERTEGMKEQLVMLDDHERRIVKGETRWTYTLWTVGIVGPAAGLVAIVGAVYATLRGLWPG